MKVNIETAWGHRATAELEGGTFIFDTKPNDLFKNMEGVRVWGEGYRKYYHNPTVIELPSGDGRYHCKLIAPTSIEERVKNIEDALVELYELLEV